MLEYFKNEPGVEIYSEPVKKWQNVHGSNILICVEGNIGVGKSHVLKSVLQVQCQKMPVGVNQESIIYVMAHNYLSTHEELSKSVIQRRVVLSRV